MHSAAIRRIALATMLGCTPGAAGATPVPRPIGLPITRNYTLEDIGDVSRGLRLGFDRIGRLAVISGDSYIVLNDSTWLDIAEQRPDLPSMLQVVTDENGNSYFGALAAWGVVEYTAAGTVRPRSLRPAQCPPWVTSTGFTHIVPQESGVYFAGLNGVVFWDRATDEQIFMPVAGVSALFALNGKVYVSSHSRGLQYADGPRRRVESVPGAGLDAIAVECIASLGEGRALMATAGQRLLVFDGQTLTEWDGQFGANPPGRITALQTLSGGGVAVAIDGKGLFILSTHGELQLSLTSAEYHRIHRLVTRESGVLWIAAENAVQKLLYGSPITIVDQRLGIPISWPRVVQWNERTLISSSGRLYAEVAAADGLSTRFELLAPQPSAGAWAVAASGSHLLVGNNQGVYVRNADGFQQVASRIDINQLVMVSPDLCYAIGATEITVLQLQNGRWVECAARVPGVGFPAVVHAAGDSAWIELGSNRAARVWWEDGDLHTRVFDQFPWTEPTWTNISVVGETVMLNGGSHGALFFNERSGNLCEAPELRRLLDSAPFSIVRIVEDRKGQMWATHERGVFRVQVDPSSRSGYRFDRSLTRSVRDFQPRIQIAGADVWISTEKVLYHVTAGQTEIPRAPSRPSLVSITDRRTNTELFSLPHSSHPISRFPYARNNLSFRFFSGGYSSVRPPEYEFALSGGAEDWSIRSTDSLLALHALPEGAYRLTARVFDLTGTPLEPFTFEFAVAPPWYRMPFAYLGYGVAAVVGGWGLLSWTVRRTRQRNAFLEDLVRDRTEELRAAMIKLNEETRNAATLAERNRVAGEIHDSLQQGLSGLMLQLDATLKVPDLTADVRAKLTVARNMVSFTRHEVQQAVWDLESPLLENADLAEALRKMAGLISSGTPRVEIQATGTSTDVPSGTIHQLLRIAQEAITNAVRHGEARTIFVHLDYAATALSLEIVDDGRGFVPEDVFANGLGHFGLRGLRARASKINADLQILSAPGRGTTVRITIPFSRDPTPSHAITATA